MSDISYKSVTYKNNKYAVISIDYKDIKLPVLINGADLNVVKRLKKRWTSNQDGFTSYIILCALVAITT